MAKGIIGKKIGMTQIFDRSGKVVPVTVIEAGPCPVVQVKTNEQDGYEAVQLGFGFTKPIRVTKPLKGHFSKADTAPVHTLREFRLNGGAQWLPEDGGPVKADIFAQGDCVDATGTSKGKGWAGAIKRWNFSRLKESHGTGPVARHAGSLGACSDPSRVFKGKKLSGHLGHERVTIQNLTVVKVDAEHNLIAVKGAVPGPRGGIVLIRTAVKKGGAK
ncbi:MAG: 50S ribosomal protein L3 [Oscillospiraceae bacterium]|jgi:large subunit ribosomal protein L3|nr:50S ribosomal protein L3 [Oscillospiraceae bacterium]